jgi:signal peptidase I
MLPTYQDAESIVFINKKDNYNVKFGDVVRANKFENSNTDLLYIKRVIGLPGDTIVMHINGFIISVNKQNVTYSNVPNALSYIYQTEEQQFVSRDIDFDELNKEQILKFGTIGKDFFEKIGDFKHKVILLMDNENDTRSAYIDHLMSNVQTKSVVFDEHGLATIKVPEGHFFLLSDNRPMGIDSRHFGFVHESDISAILP